MGGSGGQAGSSFSNELWYDKDHHTIGYWKRPLANNLCRKHSKRYDPRMEGHTAPDEIRSATDVARRSLALFAVIGLALRADRTAVLEWLSENDLWQGLTPHEVGFVDSATPSRKQIIDAGWLSERLIVLLWALGHIAELPPADEQCDTSVFQYILPPFANLSVTEFVGRAQLRPDADLMATADQVLDLHWVARDAKIHGRAPRRPVDLETIQERHHAINWVIGYDGLPWDEVTTDT